MKPSRGLIALDGDGVLLNYHAAYRAAWARAFGTVPGIRDPDAYWAMDRYHVPRLEVEGRAKFRSVMDEEFWSTMSAIDGALDACFALVSAGYELVCVSAVEEKYLAARTRNIRELGFPIERVFATPGARHGDTSPKATALAELAPVAFVDDYAPYLRGIPPNLHAALILREPNGSPNVGEALEWADSTHVDLAGFATWWVGER
jgi:phosphoglycolate phosphatase-like HAD superfamily hydrolase